MKNIYIFYYILFICSSFKMPTANIDGTKVLKNMYKTYKGKWYKTFTFSQTTQNFNNDTLTRTSVWHEAIAFPNKFRITIGEPKNGVAIIFTKDSSFNFNKGKLVRRTLKNEDLTFLLGGMYFIPFDSVKLKMKHQGYDFEKAYTSTWQGKKVYVLGANENDTTKKNTLFIDAEKLVVLRLIRYGGNGKEEAWFNNHKKFGKAWSETLVTFFINHALYQKEEYFNCIANGKVNNAIFDPYNFIAEQ